MLQSVRCLAAAGCLIVLSAESVFAGFVVSIENRTGVNAITSPATFTVDVTASWIPDADLHEPASVTLDHFFARFEIVPPDASTSSLKFVSLSRILMGTEYEQVQNDLQLSDTDYVFLSNSLAQTVGVPVSFVDGANEEFYQGFDAGIISQEMTSLSKLLFRLELEASGAATGSEDFLIQMITDASGFVDVVNEDFVPLPFSASEGLITLTGQVTAVPEPSLIGGSLLLMAAALLRRRHSAV